MIGVRLVWWSILSVLLDLESYKWPVRLVLSEEARVACYYLVNNDCILVACLSPCYFYLLVLGDESDEERALTPCTGND